MWSLLGLCVTLFFLHADGEDLDARASDPILVLGAGGFLGQRVVAHFHARGRAVVSVRDRAHVDLREASAFASFAAAHGPFSSVVFLACEVGGAKYLSAPSAQSEILRHNVQIFEVVFPWAREAGVPLLYAGSYMRHAGGAYGAVKALGEEYLAAMLPRHLGRGVRLWNLYGREQRSLKSHVLSDWAEQCVLNGNVSSTSSARERRQFLHVDDAAGAIVALIEHWHDDDEGINGSSSSSSSSVDARMTDVTSGVWVSLESIAAELSNVAREGGGEGCPLFPASVDAPFRPEVDPRTDSWLQREWRQWMPPSHYPRDSPQLAQEDMNEEGGELGAGGIGHVRLREGLRDLVLYHTNHHRLARSHSDL